MVSSFDTALPSALVLLQEAFTPTLLARMPDAVIP